MRPTKGLDVSIARLLDYNAETYRNQVVRWNKNQFT